MFFTAKACAKEICYTDFHIMVMFYLTFSQFFQDLFQHCISLLEAGHSIHDLMVRSMAPGFIQLHSQICQFLGMGCVMSGHVLHQRQQFLRGLEGLLKRYFK